MSDSEEDLGFQLKTLKIASKTAEMSRQDEENQSHGSEDQFDLAVAGSAYHDQSRGESYRQQSVDESDDERMGIEVDEKRNAVPVLTPSVEDEPDRRLSGQETVEEEETDSRMRSERYTEGSADSSKINEGALNDDHGVDAVYHKLVDSEANDNEGVDSEDVQEEGGDGQSEAAALPEIIGSDSESDSDGEWQNMAAIASSNIYNEKGQLEIRSYAAGGSNTLSQEMLSAPRTDSVRSGSPDRKKSATFGYTKVAAEEQAHRSYNANMKTDFLFDRKKMKRMNSSKNSLSGPNSVSQSETEKEFYDEYEEDVEAMDDLNADDQLNVTRELLDEREKFAYVGAINVLSNQLCTDLATLCLCVDIVSHKKLAQRLQFAQKDAARWKTDILNRLYLHLGISMEEIKMVEKLSMHGIRLEDLCKCLQTTQSIDNPFEGNNNQEKLDKESMTEGHALDNDKRQDVDPGHEIEDSGADEDSAQETGKYQVLDRDKDSLSDQEQENHQEQDDHENEEIYDEQESTLDGEKINSRSVSELAYGDREKFDKKGYEDEVSDELPISFDTKAVPREVVQPENLRNQDQLDVDVAWTIICDLFLILLQDSTYDARSRTLLIKFAGLLNITNLEICEFERRITDSLDMEQSTEDQIWNETKHMKDRRKRRRRKKLCYVGLAMVGGSLVLGLSGGLLAPVIGAGIAAGLSTIGITGATGFLTGAGGAAVVAVTSTAIGGNIGAKGMSRRMGSVRTFEFRPLHNNRRVNLIISVSGWMIGNEDDIRLPYSTVDPVEGDLYSLFWEPEMLKSIGQTINIVANEVFTQVLQQVLGATILTAFISAIQWPMGLSKLGYILDNPWSVSLDRAWAAGLILADTLMSKNLGDRPVTLMGFSLGSRVIYSCLVELCKRKAHGLIENVFIFGTPVVRKREHLVMARSVVSGRFVNAYSLKDWMLAYLFRAAAGGFSKVMGIAPIEGVEGIENIDCTETVDGHLAYRKNMPKLLKQLGVSVVSEEFVEIEETMDPEQVKRQRKLVHDVDAAQKKLLAKKKHNGWIPKWMKPKKSKWRSMVEDAVEEAKETSAIEEVDTPTSEPTLPKKKDSAIVDHGALMHELILIKAALHEEQLRSEQAKGEATSMDSDIPKNGEEDSPHMAKKRTPPLSPNNFQLLTAGRTILPDDDDDDDAKSHNKPMAFAFSDDF